MSLEIGALKPAFAKVYVVIAPIIRSWEHEGDALHPTHLPRLWKAIAIHRPIVDFAGVERVVDRQRHEDVLYSQSRSHTDRREFDVFRHPDLHLSGKVKNLSGVVHCEEVIEPDGIALLSETDSKRNPSLL